MGLTKTQMFSLGQNRLAALHKVFSHPARLAILQHISERPSCICNDIVKEIGLSQPTISQHLNELKKIGLIRGKIQGKAVSYYINEKKWKEVQMLMNSFFIKEDQP